MDINTKESRRLTNHRATDVDPAWSPDGQWIAFRSTQDGIGGIHVMNADGEKQRALTQVSATGLSWASNGKQIYFSTEKLGGVKVPTLFAVDLDGENPKKLTDAGHACEEPAGSPDGQWIAYASVQDANKDIYLIRAAGGGLRNLTQDPGLDFSLTWVPSAFSVSQRANTQIVPWGILKQTT